MPRPRYHILSSQRRARPGARAPTHAQAAYPMMAEAQAVPDAALPYPQRLREDHSDYPHSASRLPSSYYQYRSEGSDTREDPPSERLSLTVEDDLQYDHIRSDNYEVVHHQVEWILRCKCSPSCSSSPAPEDTQARPQANKVATGMPT